MTSVKFHLCSPESKIGTNQKHYLDTDKDLSLVFMPIYGPERANSKISMYVYFEDCPTLNKEKLVPMDIQSTLVISKSKGPSKTVRDIRTSTYQICSIEEKTI